MTCSSDRRRLAANARGTDYAYRVGGDEFFIVLQNQSMDEIEVVEQRLRPSLRGVFSSPAFAKLGIGASIGALEIVYSEGRLETPEQVYEAVDERMYAQKHRKADSPRGVSIV
jgi:diguanylate cyclase (GGDEF)-like protein